MMLTPSGASPSLSIPSHGITASPIAHRGPRGQHLPCPQARHPHPALRLLSAPLVLLPHGDSSAPPVCSYMCGYQRLWEREPVSASAGRGEVMSLLISQQLMPE